MSPVCLWSGLVAKVLTSVCRHSFIQGVFDASLVLNRFNVGRLAGVASLRRQVVGGVVLEFEHLALTEWQESIEAPDD